MLKKYLNDVDDRVFARPRFGIGSAFRSFCVACGRHGENDLAIFVDSVTDGKKIVSWIRKAKPFNILGIFGTFIDYRDYEPNRIQLKICACDSHVYILNDIISFADDDVARQEEPYLTKKRVTNILRCKHDRKMFNRKTIRKYCEAHTDV